MAIRFDATTDRLLRSNPDVGASELYSWMGWFNLAVDTNFYASLYSLNTDDQATNFNLDVTLLDDDGVSLHSYVGDGSDSGFSALGTALTLNTWNFIAGVRDAMNSYKVILNGVLDTTNTYDCTGRSASFTREEVAENYSSNQFNFNGRVYNFMSYRRVFTLEQIRAQMRSFYPIFSPPYLRLWTPMRDRGFRARHRDVVKGNYWTVGGTLADEPNPPKAAIQRIQFYWLPLVTAGSTSTDLTVQDATHEHAADSITLTVSAYLAVADATHEHAADSIVLTAQSDLAVQDATHEHAADGITLSIGVSLAVQDATHEHAADSIDLTVNAALVVADATHEHAADAITLTANAYLVVTDATHEHATDAIGLTVASYLTVQDATHEHSVDPITLTIEGQTNLEVQDATHIHAADAITLTANSYLAVTDATHEHAVDAIVLTVASYLAVTDATHVHVVDPITLTVEGQVTLVVQDATHVHVVDAITIEFVEFTGLHIPRHKERGTLADWNEPLTGLAPRKRWRKIGK